MRHGRKIHKLERPRAHRQALICNLASALITHGKIRTTEAKAKALKPVIDKLITTAKLNTVHARRLVARTIKSRDTIKKLFDEVAPDMLNRTSGYSRIMRVGSRRGDGAPIVLVELTSAKEKREEKGKKEKKGWKKLRARSKAGKKAREAEAAASPGEDQETETVAKEKAPDDASASVGEASAASDEKPDERQEKEPDSDPETS